MKYFLLILAVVVLFSCNSGDKIPDVSNIKIDLNTQRFEQAVFALDSTNFAPLIDKLQAKYPNFTNTFVFDILRADPKWPNDTIASYVWKFANDTLYKSVYDSSQLLFQDFSPYEKEIRNAFQFCKYYFPAYKTPQNILTFIGPLDGTSIAITDEAIVIGLQHYLGKDYSLYKTSLVQDTYPQYITNNFEAPYIAVNVMKQIILDMYPEKLDERSLVQQMVEKGKRLYLLKKLLPYKEENKLIGYTAAQLKDCYEQERVIWDMFVQQNNLLQSVDDNVIKNYIGESPKTQELGDASPGNIGSFAGWQIVKKYMKKFPETSLLKLMAMDDDTIFQEAKYKP